MKNNYTVTLRISVSKGTGDARTTTECDSKTVRDGTYEMCRNYILDEIASAVQQYRKVNLSESEGITIDDTSYKGDTILTKITMQQKVQYRQVSTYEILTGIRSKK